ncbi:hypothetical protein DES45_104439 [Microvirga subterranea]|uniref:Uncharacterized protein n=1 Tax=Microvirga subterranea TaxID=186651 RepID=A0A370HLR7_9HYPH|nr:hypothetical protein DES45_104439 [Microvirga subterranea]
MWHQRLDEPPLRELPDERFVPTVPDFLVEEVRLEAAAARLVEPDELRDLEALLLAALFVPPLAALRLLERDAGFAAERDAVERAALERLADFDAPFALLREAVEREGDAFLAVDFAAVFLAEDREVADLAAVFFAAVFFAPDLAADFAPDLAAVFVPDFAALLAAVRVEDLAAVLLERAVDFAADFVPELREAVLFEPDFDALLAAVFVPPERDEVPVDFEALLRAVEVPDFLAPDLAEDVEPPVFLALDELRRALLFFAPDFLVLVAPVSPVNSIVSGLDLSSVGIAASFKGLRVQPSRLQGNVVIPRGFRLSESVESRTRTISVDTLASRPVRTCLSGA